MSVAQEFFGWPSGAVWGNLLASALLVPISVAVHHWRMRRAHSAATAAQTEELKAHIDARLEGRQP